MKSTSILGAGSFVAACILAGCGSSEGTTEQTQSVTSGAAASPSPRIWLDAATLSSLRKRAATGDAAWTTLAARCNADAAGTVNTPGQNAYPDAPGIGQGYEGDGYLPEILALGLCYQTAVGVDDASATRWAQAGARVLAAMATPAGSGGQPPSTDDGYGIRNYGVGMAIGYDWLRPALDAATAAKVDVALTAWIAWYDVQGFIRGEPIGNYFAGYLFAKGAAAIALGGTDPVADLWWSDVATRMWPTLAGPAYSKWLAGGGWPEGWQYGPLSVRNIVGFLWAANTAKGMTWWNDVPLAHAEAEYIGEFAWPSRKHMDDRGTVHAQAALAPSASTVAMMATVLEKQGDTFASSARGIASDLLSTTGESLDPWAAFLFWDKSATSVSPVNLPVSYFAHGPDHVAMRSSWDVGATWASFVSGAYIDAPDSGEQYFDQGGLAIASGDQPVLINATGWLPQAAGDAGESFVYDDTWGNRTRLLDNTFYVSGAGQNGIDPTQSKTHVERFEEGGTYVRARGTAIEQMYAPSGVVTQFVRDVAYVRPGTFIVYDRTSVAPGVASTSADQWMAWHVPGVPAQSTAADGTLRFDVPTGGTIRALLPRAVTPATVGLLGVATRIELHSTGAAQDWLTAVTVGSSPDVERLSTADGNVTSGNVVGAHVRGGARSASTSRESVVLFPSDHAAVAQSTGTDYAIAQAADTDHVLFDMAPGSYTVTVTPTAAGKLAIHVTQAAKGPFQPTTNGTLVFTVSAAGVVIPPAQSTCKGS